MGFGGLRGAVGFSLIYIIYEEDKRDEDDEVNRLFLTTTLFVVFFTVFIQGGAIKPLVNHLKIARKEDRDRGHIVGDVNRKTVEHLMAGVEAVVGQLTIGSYFKIVEAFDNMYIRKILLSKKAQDRMTLRCPGLLLKRFPSCKIFRRNITVVGCI